MRRAFAGGHEPPLLSGLRFADERVPTVEEVLKLVSEYKQHDVLIAVDLKAEGVEHEVVRLADKHGVCQASCHTPEGGGRMTRTSRANAPNLQHLVGQEFVNHI